MAKSPTEVEVVLYAGPRGREPREVGAMSIPVTYRREVVHQCPPNGSGVMPCCGRTPFEVPRTDRMTETGRVTCAMAEGERDE